MLIKLMTRAPSVRPKAIDWKDLLPPIVVTLVLVEAAQRMEAETSSSFSGKTTTAGRGASRAFQASVSTDQVELVGKEVVMFAEARQD